MTVINPPQEGKKLNIARVFPTRTNISPTDSDAYFGYPELFTPKYDEVHISTVFTWDKEYAERLAIAWADYGKVTIGGPALDDLGSEFMPGRYTRPGVTITSRGCPNNCWFCFVPKREGKLRELEVKEGNIILDNNLTACSESHLDKVFDMLKKQKQVSFNQGLESRRITDKFVDRLCSLPSIKDIWLACDTPGAIKPLKKALEKLSKYFNRNKLRCYVLIGKDMAEEESRLRTVYELGCLPFAMLYKDGNGLQYSKKWKDFQRTWARPAAYKTLMKFSPS